MKTLKILPLLFAAIFLFSCGGEDLKTVKGFKPIYGTMSDLESMIHSSPAQELKYPGKIYVKGNYLFINEIYRGVHIYDNSDPSNPSNIGFITVPGNLDIEIRGNYLYADYMNGLATLDISDIFDVKLTDYNNTFNPDEGQLYPPQGMYSDRSEERVYFECTDLSKGIVIGWEEVTMPESACYFDRDISEESATRFQGGLRNEAVMMAQADASSSGGGTASGVGGSMARFKVVGDHLYILMGNDLHALDINQGDKPELKNSMTLNTIAETIFAMEEYLLLGTQNGVMFYSIDNPSSPSYISTYHHILTCDPVVARDDHAYSTLRVESECMRGVNQLDVINIANISSPYQVAEFEMNNPKGLAILDDFLFICDADQLVRFDISSPASPVQQGSGMSLEAGYDLIPNGNVLIISTKNGIYQYEVDGAGNLSLLSTISK